MDEIIKLTEVRDKRSLTSKHFLQNDGSFKMDAHVGHINYFNKLGLGNSINDFRSIDWTLNWDEEKRGWFFNFHSFHPFLPEFADEWVEFRDVFEAKDQTVKYRAHAEHIKGRLVMPNEIGLTESDLNCVIYDDAFGKGIDYILYFTNQDLKKTVRIRNEFKEIKDYSFDFDIELPNDCKVNRAISEKDIAYELDITKSKEFDTSKETLINTINGNTFILPFVVWDSGNSSNHDYHRENIKVNYSIIDGVKILTKNLPLSFMENSVGDVWTDTTTTYYAGAGNGYMDEYAVWHATWAAAHDATSCPSGRVFVNNEGDQGAEAEVHTGNTQFSIGRGFFPVDTSALSDTAIISAASFFVVMRSYGNTTGSGANVYTALVGPTDQASFTTLANTDFNNCGDVATPTKWTADLDVSGYSTSTYNEMVLNAAGIAGINKTGYTAIGQRCGWDINNTPPADTKFYGASFNQLVTSAKKPYLSITYTESSSTPSRASQIRRFARHG